MSLGLAERQDKLLDDMARFCDEQLAETSIYSVLHRERDSLFPDEMFSDLFSDRGRHCIPPSVVAIVMVLQKLAGLSDREAVEQYMFDARWRYAAGVGSYDCGGVGGFAHTVLVDMRARLARSARPRRIFEASLDAAKKAGFVGAKRVLDSTPLYDAVATMDTITLIRSALRGLLKVADQDLEAELRAVLKSGDDYATSAKPQIDWDDQAARDALIDSRARDAYACLGLLEGRQLPVEVGQAAQLLATVVGQDLCTADDGTFRIAHRVAKDRVISTVDPEARHGHKTSARGYDGYKGHAALDPDSEIITATTVSPANTGDAASAAGLVQDIAQVDDDAAEEHQDQDVVAGASEGLVPGAAQPDQVGAGPMANRGRGGRARQADKQAAHAARAGAHNLSRRAKAKQRRARAAEDQAEKAAADNDVPAAYGDAAYGSGELLAHLTASGIDPRVKTQPPVAAGGMYTKDSFDINLVARTVTCPSGATANINKDRNGDGAAWFKNACEACPLRSGCTKAAGGRTISVSRYEELLVSQRERCADPDFLADYRATRPKVERKLAHLMRRRHGGRRARVRGRQKVDADFSLLAAAVNLARLASLGLRSTANGWAAGATV